MHSSLCTARSVSVHIAVLITVVIGSASPAFASSVGPPAVPDFRMCGTWSQLPTEIAPIGGGSMIFDPIRHRMIQFVRTAGDTTVPALWELPAATSVWSPMSVTGTPPRNGDLLYDSVSDRLIVVRSDDEAGSPVSFLSLGGTQTWTHVTPSGPPPHGFGCPPVFDPAHHRVVAFGGILQSGSASTYALDVSLPIPVWTEIPGVGAPPRRFDGSSIYDSARGRMVLFGGTDGFTQAFQDFWQLDLTGTPSPWSQILPAGDLPSPRYSAGSVYDSGRDRMVIFAGSPWGTTLLTDTWAISFADGPQSTDITPVVGPSRRRIFGSEAFDPDVDRIVVFGGYDGGSLNQTDELPFGDIVTHLTIMPAGAGDVVQDPNVACPDSGSTMTLTAQPAVGYAFSHWSGDVTGNANPLSLVITGDRNIVAHFIGYAVTATVDPPGTGVVTRDPVQSTYAPGSNVTLTATATGNATFSHWSGDATGTANPLLLTVDADKSVVAHFDPGPPVIDRFSPRQAPIGAPVTIFGMSFTGVSAVDFNGVSAVIGAASDGQISTTVPAGATDGPLHVTTPEGTATSSANFKVGETPPPGINLSWDDCGAYGVASKSFACTTGVGPPFRLVGSYVPPPGIDEFYGMAAQIDLSSGGETIPDWWKHGSGQCRARTGLSLNLDFTSGPNSCVDFYSGQAYGGYAYDVGFGSPNRARLRIQCAVPAEHGGPLEPGTEYYAFSMNIARNGTDVCAGCSQSMCIVLNEIQLFQPVELGNDPQLNQAHERNFVSWQSAPPDCPLSTATEASVIASDADVDRVRLVWLAPRVRSANVQRREPAGRWETRGTLVADGGHRLTYEDTSVMPGGTYAYRLEIHEGSGSRHVGETTVTVPGTTPLALSGVNWSRDGSLGIVSFSLPRRGTASLELFDAAGRRVQRRVMADLARGRHVIEMTMPESPASGVYFARLTQGDASARRRFVIVR